MDLGDFIAGVESPTGEDNKAGSGAFSRFQFMPATAVELARKTPWGASATPANVKELVLAAPGRDRELFDLYTDRSKGALATAGLPVTPHTILATHRFGQSGGVSVLQAPATMPVQQWVNSVNWGPGVAPDAVIRQNRLDRFATVGDLRRGFLGGPQEAPSIGDAVAPTAPAAPAPQPVIQARPDPAATMLAESELASVFAAPERKRPKRNLFA